MPLQFSQNFVGCLCILHARYIHLCVWVCVSCVSAERWGHHTGMSVLIKALSHDLVAPTGAADGRRAAGVLSSGCSLRCRWRRRNKKQEERLNIGVWIQNAMQSWENHWPSFFFKVYINVSPGGSVRKFSTVIFFRQYINLWAAHTNDNNSFICFCTIPGK